MIIWITTIGWSPFAVINPIWAYCKENDNFPDKVIMIYTPYEKIRNNLRICKRFISKILKSYNGNFEKDSIIEEQIKNDNIELYADKLSRIIEREKALKPNKIILDMTPGRKYMSAINVYYGYNLAEIPIQVFYLHLEESKYQDVPYPLSPIIKNELIDILESTKIFSRDLERSSESLEDKDEDTNQSKDLISEFDDDEEKKEYLTLLSLKKNFNTKTKIRKFTFGYGVIIRGHELDKILKGLMIENHISSQYIIDNNQRFKNFNLTEKGKDFLIELKEKHKKEKLKEELI